MYLLLLLLFNSGWAQVEKPMKNSDAFEKRFKEISDNTSSIVCDFTQKKNLSFSKNPLVSTGKIWYQGDKMRWEQFDPEAFLMIINRETLSIREDGRTRELPLNQNKMMKGLKEIMMGSINGSFFQSNQFRTDLFENDEYNIIQVTPSTKRIKKMFTEIKMYFNVDTYRLKKLQLFEPNGDDSEILFNNAIFNKIIEPSQFIL